jgi:two-component system, chemotaxis family, chemotaxis protein CheY
MANILIADDMLTVQHNLTFILKNYNHNVIATASNCTETIKKYRECSPDVVLLDILGMGSFYEDEARDIDSFDVIKILVKEDKNANIIILTASPKEEYIKKSVLLGAKGFLVKGASNDKIIATIEDILKKSINK